jgi:DNA-binding ferritin-like protein (Dps family)
MTEITSLTTANPDPSEIAQVVSGAFDTAYAALQSAWESMQAGQTEAATNAMVVVDQQLQVMQEQVAVQASLIAGQQEVIDTQGEQIEALIENMEDAKQESYQDGYRDGVEEAEYADPDPYWLESVIDEEVAERERQLERESGWAADKLRTVGEHDLAAEIEEKAKQAVTLKEEAEKLIERGNATAWQKRQNQLPLVIDQTEDSDDE